LTAILAVSAALAAARSGRTPTVVLTNPSTNGQIVTTLRNSEGFPILASVVAPTGINRCTVEVKRLSDSNYWNGTAWVATTVSLTPIVTNVNPSPPYYSLRENAGPGSASLTAGTSYQVYAECVETDGTRSSSSVTVTR
jgi:hypothetical protein